MRFNALLFLLSLSCLYLALAQVSYEDCCLKYVGNSRIIQKHAVRYRHQETDGGCNIRATIFTLKKGRAFCADPRMVWVQELMKKIDMMGVKKSGKHNIHKPKRG